jgi:hypothetical protein
MDGRLSAGALSAGIALLALPGAALCEETGAAARAPEAAPRGAVVVAVGEGATEAARPLAHEVYREEALRPGIDDATARALIGEPLAKDAKDAAPKLAEIAEIRASIARSGSDAAGRLLLASIGEGARARIVVTVSMDGGRAVARVLRVETKAFEGVELGATVETPAAGGPGEPAKIYRWPGAVATLLPLASASPAAPSKSDLGSEEAAPKSAAAPPVNNNKSPGPVRPTADAKKPAAPPPKPAPVEDRPAWQSPWFWVTLGGVAAAGLAAFGIAKAVETDDGLVRLQGRVAQ